MLGFTSWWYVRILVVNVFFRFPSTIIISSPSLHGDIRGEPFLLPLTSLVVLEPVEDILAFNLAVLPQPSRDPLNLLCTWGSNPIVVVKVLQYPYLVGCGSPPCTALPAHVAPFSTAPILVCWLLLSLMMLWLLGFHDGCWKIRKKTKRSKQKQCRTWERKRRGSSTRG